MVIFLVFWVYRLRLTCDDTEERVMNLSIQSMNADLVPAAAPSGPDVPLDVLSFERIILDTVEMSNPSGDSSRNCINPGTDKSNSTSLLLDILDNSLNLVVPVDICLFSFFPGQLQLRFDTCEPFPFQQGLISQPFALFFDDRIVCLRCQEPDCFLCSRFESHFTSDSVPVDSQVTVNSLPHPRLLGKGMTRIR